MSASKIKRILIITGEVSGDLHASFLVKALLKQNPELNISAIGSDKLKAAGATILSDLTKRSTIGFLEAFRHIPSLLNLKHRLVRLFLHQEVDLVICVDYQGFNMIVAKEAKRRDIPVYYYIPPQEWIWGSEKGMQQVVDTVTRVYAIFKEEYEAYKTYTENAYFFGHPLIDIITQHLNNHPSPKTQDANTIAVFPGSRRQEITYIFPEMVAIIKQLKTLNPAYRFKINLPNDHYLTTIKRKLGSLKDSIPIAIGKNYETLQSSSYALLTSGTVCLEAAILKVPHVALYKFNRFSYPLVKKALKRFKFDYFSLPNIILGKAVVPEYLQNFSPRTVATQIHTILASPEKLSQTQTELAQIQTRLMIEGNTSVLDEIAKSMLTQY